MNSPRKSLVVWAVLGVLLTLMVAVDSAWGQQQCSEFELVGKPTVLTRANNAPAYVEAPGFAQTSMGLAMIGSPTFLWSSSKKFQEMSFAGAFLSEHSRNSAGVIRSANGVASDLPRPDSARWGRDFRVIDMVPSPIVFWGTEQDTVKRSMITAEAIWSAHLVDGRWSEPVPVIRTASIDWTPSTSTVLTVRGVPTVIASGLDVSQPVKRFGFFYARVVGDRWQVVWTHTGMSPAYLDAIDDGAGNTVIAMVADVGRDSLQQPINGVYVVREHDGTLQSPVLVHRFTGDFGHKLKMGMSPDGALHIVWMESVIHSFSMLAIRHLVSHDQGLTWSETNRMALDGVYLELFALSRPGRPLVIASHSVDRKKISVWSWGAADWRRVVDIPVADGFGRLTMEWMGTRLLVAWPEASPLGKPLSDEMWPVTMTAELLCR